MTSGDKYELYGLGGIPGVLPDDGKKDWLVLQIPRLAGARSSHLVKIWVRIPGVGFSLHI